MKIQYTIIGSFIGATLAAFVRTGLDYWIWKHKKFPKSKQQDD